VSQQKASKQKAKAGRPFQKANGKGQIAIEGKRTYQRARQIKKQTAKKQN
jgi:hypothetical protein